MMAAGDAAFASRQSARQSIGIWDLLVWAFQRECAQLDPPGDMGGFGRHMMSSSYLICQHEMLGCHIDGGGRSPTHPDADLVSAALAVLPDANGGWRMATTLAELARAGTTPDWRVPVSIDPVNWNRNGHGKMAAVEVAGVVDPAYGFPMVITARGNIDKRYGKCCPVIVRGDASQQARARRVYLDWWGALLSLRASFRLHQDLTSFWVSKAMPPREPWKKTI